MKSILLDRRINNLLKERNWNGFTEAQERAIPEILKGEERADSSSHSHGKTEPRFYQFFI
jgi:hypothetical protein